MEESEYESDSVFCKNMLFDQKTGSHPRVEESVCISRRKKKKKTD